MEYDLSYDDSPSLKQTLADLLRGMSKKQAYQELGQGIQNTAKVIPSVVESLGRGAVAQVPGTFGDISELARQFAPETMQSVMGNRVAPTTEEILAKIPRLNSDYQGSSQHETIGGLISPAMPSLLRAGAKATQNMPGGMIVKPEVVNELGMATTLPKDIIFAEAVKNTPSARISDEGLHINLMRKQKPEQAMTESVRSGVFYLPEGSTNIKHYGGSNSYGGTEKITGETLYKNPLFVKGATGGKAPETAYAQLTDKKQLKQLQDDVFKAITGPKDIKTDLVQQFLDTHAPDLSDYTHYIIDNSRNGNQLRYALQEAAVAQKVRDAGYDAVIGHSKGKKGSFISEIFDVRESHYPNEYGDFQLNPKFEEMYQNTPSRKDIIEEQFNNIKK